MFIVEMEGITKSFLGIVANDVIIWSKAKGRFTRCSGRTARESRPDEILFGLYQPEEGTI